MHWSHTASTLLLVQKMGTREDFHADSTRGWWDLRFTWYKSCFCKKKRAKFGAGCAARAVPGWEELVLLPKNLAAHVG